MPLPSVSSSPRTRLQLTSLEDRSVPAVTAVFAGGVLTITGDAAANDISVQLVSGKVKAFDGTTDLLPAATITPAALTGIVVNAGDGNDTVDVFETIVDPATINGGTGDDQLYGGKGNDSITTGTDGIGDLADGRAGNDTITGGAGDDFLFGGLGNDVLNAGDGANSVEGGDGNDSITGGDGSDALYGGKGLDTINGGGDADLIFGGGGAGGGVDKVGDLIDGGAGDDSVFGNLGNDSISGGSGNDRIEGDLGNDSIVAGPEADAGVSDEDFAFGGLGNDTISGGFGLDALYGEAGNDVLTGGAGNDTLSGGLGRDTFTGHGAAAPGDRTTADNFDTYQDEFDFTKPINGKATALALAATELDISDTLSALGSIVNSPSNFNLAGRLRYLGSGDYLVKLGDVNGTDWVPVNFNGTWTDNDAKPSAQERFTAATSSSEKREFWPLLFHRARMAGKGTFTFDTYIDQPAYDALSVSPGLAVEELSAHPQSAANPTSPIAFVGTAPPAGFGFSDIQTLLATFRWLTVKTAVTPALAGLQGDQAYSIVGAFNYKGTNYIKLYNTTGYDSGVAGTTVLDPGTAAKKNDGFITVSVTDFYNSANFATAYVN